MRYAATTKRPTELARRNYEKPTGGARAVAQTAAVGGHDADQDAPERGARRRGIAATVSSTQRRLRLLGEGGARDLTSIVAPRPKI